MQKEKILKNETAKNRRWLVLFIFVWCVQMLTAVYFCMQKKGFHEDEFYSYYSTSRTYGLTIEDGAWMEHDDYYREFVVLEGEGFQYGLVKLVQSWDVHPPVYYWVLHTICSLFPGQFSKWFGLGINLAAFGISMFLLRTLALEVTKGNEKIAWLVCLFYGFTPAVMSSVVFIRMYAMLTVFVYLCAILHMKALGNSRLPFVKFLLPLMIVTYLGFLTQYYYFIFLFFMAAAFCIYLLWKDRNLINCIRYACSVAAAFILAYLTYPACLGQMFRGQRGAQATNSFFDLSNTWMRLTFFWNLLDEYVFGKMLPVILLIVLCMFLYIFRKKSGRVKSRAVSEEKNVGYWLLFVAVIGYFLAVSKTALLLGNTSVRYQMPVYGIIVLLLFEGLAGMGKTCFKEADLKESDFGMIKEKIKNPAIVVLMILCLLVDAAGVLSRRVVFLYPEAEEQCAFAKEMAKRDVPVVCFYDAGQSWCVWDCADEFFEYDRIYFASLDDVGAIEDDAIAECGELVVYISNTAEAEEQIRRVQSANPGLTECELQYRGKYYDVYKLTGCGKESIDAVKEAACGVNIEAVSGKEIIWDNIYDAYYHKYIELVKKYGIGQLVENNGDAEKIWDYGCSYLGGVCVVDLLDFNEDGIEDLFLVYSKGWLTGKNADGYAIPQAGTYEIELWTCIDGKLTQLLEESHVSSYLSFRTDYWDNDCCYVTIYADETGKPILQLHQEEIDGWYDANFYYEDNELQKDYFIRRGDSFTKNGERITQEEWQQELEGYTAILLGAGLSSDDFSAEIFAICYGVDIPDTLEQTRRVVECIRKKEEGHYYICKETYSQLYMQQIFQMNLQEDIQGVDSSAEYMLYDIDRDEVPELIVRTGNCEAAYRFYVYTVKEGMLKECGDMDGGHSLLYVDGDGGLIRYEAHMDAYYLVRYWLEGTELKSEEITDGYQYANSAEGEYYPDLEDLGYGEYRDVLYHSYGGTPLKIYDYEKKAEE